MIVSFQLAGQLLPLVPKSDEDLGIHSVEELEMDHHQGHGPHAVHLRSVVHTCFVHFE